MEAIILAGGLGTRLQSVVQDVPKCMAPVAGKPFLFYLLKDLETAGFQHVILALGYKHEVVTQWISTCKTALKISFVVENEPLGTGGAVKLSLAQTSREAVFTLNGDTFLALNYPAMMAFHNEKKAAATLALKEMHHFERYGMVETNEDARIVRFREKQYCDRGFINGGVYVINRNVLDGFPEKFSLEKDFFEPQVSAGQLAAFPTSGYFIDIGVPEDYHRAQIDFYDGKTLV